VKAVSRKALGFIATAGLLSIVGVVLWSAPAWFFTLLARLHPGCLYQVPTPDLVVALTIDDSPDSISTSRILDQLRRHNAGATFFLITDRVRGQERLIERIVQGGHQIANHFTRDRPSIWLDRREFEADLLQGHQALSKWVQPRWARPGSGWYTQKMVDVMRRHGYRCALGSVYPFDVLIPSVPWAGSYILRNVRPGAIIVLHDGGDRGLRTARVLSDVLPKLRRRGYRVLSLSELVALDSRRIPGKENRR
jgi:peptidoglycan-N-acetylglucosamine deacetylase